MAVPRSQLLKGTSSSEPQCWTNAKQWTVFAESQSAQDVGTCCLVPRPNFGTHVLTCQASCCAQEVSSDDSASCLAFRASQGRQRRLIFSIYLDAGAVQRLLAYRVPNRPACCYMAGWCTGCQCLAYLHGWQNCLARSTATLTCSRGAEVADPMIKRPATVVRVRRASWLLVPGRGTVNVKIAITTSFVRATNLASG